MNHLPGVLFRLAAVSVCLFVSGCGGASVPTVPVHGTVTMNGKPLPGGTVTLVPIKIAAGLPNRPAQGGIANDGTYTLSTFRPNDGAVPGDYAVMVRGIEAPPPIDEFTKPKQIVAGPPIPAIYSDPEKTPLKVTIATSSAAQSADFDLNGK